MWEPSNEIEHRLREALRAEDQDGYFRILAQIELVLPLSYEDANGSGADTWATWTTDDRTHILAFTSETALQVCLRNNAGASRRVSFASLAESWPDEEWWLAVNPGLPIEGYLPAWFVAQVAQGMTTVPVDPAPEPEPGPDPYGQQGGTFSSVSQHSPFTEGQSDPFANPMAPAPAPRQGSFMPPAPPVPDVPPAPRRSSDLNGGSGNHSTVAGTTEAGLPLRQPPRDPEAPEADPFNGHSFSSQPPPEPEPPLARPQGFGSQPQGFGSQPQGFTSQPPAAPSPQETAFPADPQWPSAQDQWPDAPDWLRDQQPDPTTLPTRDPAPPTARPEPFPAADSFGSQLGDDPFAVRSSGDAFATPGRDSSGTSNGEAFGSEPPRSAEAFASMSSAFGRKAAEPAPQPSAPAGPVELTGEAAEPLLAEAASSGDTAAFLQTLLCATVILPVGDPAAAHIRVGDPAFRWASDIVDGIIGITVYTTIERMAARAGEDTPYTTVPFGWLIQHWPGQEYSLYVNPGTEVGANMSGAEVEPLRKWAEAKDLLAFATEMERRQAAAARAASPSQRVQPVLWQKTIPHQQVPFYLERGYDRVGGFVHPAEAVDHLRTPAQLYLALGLIRSSEDFSPTDDSVHVLRWIGYRTDLYPTAIGGNDFATAEARGGTVVEPGPFRGDGFAPSEGDERIPEHKVDSVRLPHGAKILRIDSRGEVTEVAVYDSDTREWTPVDGAYGGPAAIEAPALPAAPSDARPPTGPMGEAYGYDSALGEAWGDADGHYDLVRPHPEERAASVLDHRDREWKDA
ncbi:SseB family protein [Glycomyces sp. TRM65418]|uniref:SseB family protein n=1 Tax=Glycomyces sp. TRM65418 TaxID=2867006 RepID=UPI001CE4DE50|nr:SseB family protein [Glycomyces sp. TRM65418]MCC3763754.1 SseB family protein [Glycomyces sp. TRM65418]QZD53465.1 SseB family protein [Glycomyces sp. TRM65418]